jgi:hypothetical protein
MAADVSNSPPTALRSRLVIAALCLVAVTACGPGVTSPHDTQGHAGIFNNRSADDLIAAIQHSGLPAPNPRSVTATECPPVGCVERVDTDTVSVMKFPTTGRAELYAGSAQRCFQVADVVVAFAPGVSPSQQQQYERVVTREIQ